MLLETTLDDWRQWDKVKELIVPLDEWCFRGQGDSTWGLKTTLERPFVKSPTLKEFVFGENQFQREKKILFHFKRGAHNYTSNLPKNDNDNLEWLSLIQHYGGLTRLLDFTYSLYIAAYFSITSAVKQATIWAINLPILEEKLRHDFSIQYTSHEEKIIRHQKIASTFIDNESAMVNYIFNVEPSHLNDRMSLQRGLFLFPCNIEDPFEYNLMNMFDLKHDNILNNTNKIPFDEIDTHKLIKYLVLKINLPKITHNAIRYDLIKMNITSATLFPGLDGFARSLAQYLYKSYKL